MGEYRGRAKKGMALDLTGGSFLLILTITLLAVKPKNEIIYFISIVFSASLSTFLFVHLYSAIREKRLVVNDIGIFLYVGKRVTKKEYWNDIKQISSSSFPGKYPRIGFMIFGKKKMDINDRDVMGPASMLREAFIEIAKMAAEREIDIDDPLGWATGIGNIHAVNPENYEGIWYKNNLNNYREGMYLILVFLFAGIGSIIAGIYMKNEILIISGATIAFITSLFLVLLLFLYLKAPRALYMEDEGIKIKFVKEEKGYTWFDFKGVECLGNMGGVRLTTKQGKYYVLYLKRGVCDAIKRKWWNRWY